MAAFRESGGHRYRLLRKWREPGVTDFVNVDALDSQAWICFAGRSSGAGRGRPKARFAQPCRICGRLSLVELAAPEPPTSWVRGNAVGSLEDADGQGRLF
jgi:hypothetical protein